MSLLSTSEKERVAEAVRQVESITAGELVVVVATRSDDYALFRGGFALALSLLVAQEAGRHWDEVTVSVALWLFAALWVAFYFLTGWSPIVRFLVPRARRAASALARAERAFVEEGVMETRARSGVLIFLSEVEREIVVLADKGIHERAPAEEWATCVSELSEGLKAGEPMRSLLRIIERLGLLLSQHFPIELDDKNELPDAVREV